MYTYVISGCLEFTTIDILSYNATSNTSLECAGCGKTNRLITTCHFEEYPHFNSGRGAYI